MKKLLASVSALALCACVVPDQSLARPRHGGISTGGGGGGGGTQLVCDACDTVPTSWSGTTYYVKPTGSDAAAGTSLGTAFLTCGKARDTVVDGDTIRFESGSYGDCPITNKDHTTFVRMMADTGQTPVFSTMSISGSTHWFIQGLTFQSLRDGDDSQVPISGNSSDGASSNIVLDSDHFQSTDDATMVSWDGAAWQTNARRWAILIDGLDTSSTYAKKISLTNLTIKNIRGGIGLTADDLLVDSTTLDHFGDDAMDFAGNRITISRSTCTNSLYIGDLLHNDCIQGQQGHGPAADGSDDNGSGPSITYSDITLNGDVFIDRTHTKASEPLFSDGGDGTQAFGSFDEDIANLTVINCIAIGASTHLIAFYSVHSGLIANNVALNTGLNGSGDLSGGLEINHFSHQGSASDHVTVRNNITSNLQSDFYMPTDVLDHNLVFTEIIWNVSNTGSFIHSSNAAGTYNDDNGNPNTLTQTLPSAVFTSIDTTNGVYDLTLKGGSMALSAGVTPAPNKVDGTARTGMPNLGAY